VDPSLQLVAYKPLYAHSLRLLHAAAMATGKEFSVPTLQLAHKGSGFWNKIVSTRTSIPQIQKDEQTKA
jgi:hypothetical protein